MMKAAVLGSPIDHSLSPLIHNRAYQELGVDLTYSKYEVGIEDFDTFFKTIDAQFVGLSLTMPLKESVFTIECQIDQSAAQIHSANTLVREESSWLALSTDLSAFKRLLKVDADFQVAILGAGGTARAAIGALDGAVRRIDVFNRTHGKLESLQSCARLSDVRVHSLESSLDGYDLIVSTLPAGISDTLVSNMSKAPKLFFESLYKPLPTDLSRHAAILGSELLDGIDLLVEQALDQIALFSGIAYDYESMRGLLLDELRVDFPKFHH